MTSNPAVTGEAATTPGDLIKGFRSFSEAWSTLCTLGSSSLLATQETLAFEPRFCNECLSSAIDSGPSRGQCPLCRQKVAADDIIQRQARGTSMAMVPYIGPEDKGEPHLCSLSVPPFAALPFRGGAKRGTVIRTFSDQCVLALSHRNVPGLHVFCPIY